MDIEHKKNCYLDDYKIIKTLGAGYHAQYLHFYEEFNSEWMTMVISLPSSVTKRKPPTLLLSNTNSAS